jgi:hypothetical protein
MGVKHCLILRKDRKLQVMEGKCSSKHSYPRRMNLFRNFEYYIMRNFVFHTGDLLGQ